MFQLDKSQTINTVAFYPTETLASGSGIIMYFSQSYSNTVTGSIQASVISNPTITPWVVAQFSGSVLPSASGQYNFKIYGLSVGGPAIWGSTIDEWQLMTSIWSSASGSILGNKISEDRAIISGSDARTYTQYVSANDGGEYQVYLG